MAWKIISTDVHGNEPDEEIYVIQIRFVGDSAEIHTTDGSIRLISMNERQLSTWTRKELWDNLRNLAGEPLWYEKRTDG